MRRQSACACLGWLLAVGACGGGSPGQGAGSGGSGGVTGAGGAGTGGATGATGGVGGSAGSKGTAAKRPWPDSTAKTLILADQLPAGMSAGQRQFVVGHMVGTQK